MVTVGDDLQDDFVIDDLVALSDNEGGVILNDEVSEGTEDAEQVPTVVASSASEKKRKRRQKEKERKAKKRKLNESTLDTSVEMSLTAQPPNQLSEFLFSKQTKSFTKLSAIELDDMRIPDTSIADTTLWTGPRTLDRLVEFIINILPILHTRLSQRSKANGSPTLIFVTGAALRVADVTRVLKDKRLRGEKSGEVAKLFARHFKLAEHVTYLKRTKVTAAVGTPGRIGKLLCETDALTVSALSHIILDSTFQDAKKRALLDIPETRDEVFKTVLGAKQVIKGIREGRIQVVLF